MDEALRDKLLDSFPNSKFDGVIRAYGSGHSGSPVLAVHYKRKNKYGLDGTFIVKVGSEDWAHAEEVFYNKLYGDKALAPLLARFHMPSRPCEGQAAVAYDVAFESVIVPQPLMSILDDKSYSEEEVQKQVEALMQALVNWYLKSNIANNSIVEDQHALIFRMLTAKR